MSDSIKNLFDTELNLCGAEDDTDQKLEPEASQMQNLIKKLTEENSKLLMVIAEDKQRIAEFKQKILHLESEKAEDKRKIDQIKSENIKLKFNAILSKPILDQEIIEQNSWNPEDRSLNIYVKDDDPCTFHRHPVSRSTDCIRGKIGYTKDFHVWKIVWPQKMRGTNAVIGVATKVAPLHKKGCTSLIGKNNESYGWDLTQNECNFDRISWKYPNTTEFNEEKYVAPDNIYCILDMNEGCMAFAADTDYLGVAFRGLKGKKLYPIVSCVYGHCEVTLKYLGYLEC